jgi:ATP-binding cassette subfamily F protein uup
MVFEADDISKRYGDTVIVDHFSTRVLRGDRIGLIGPNGAGKTTLLKMLLGELQPDTGEVRHGANLQVAYFDQQREQLDPERTVADTVADGGDTVVVNGQPRHVIGYLRDFLFPAERARSPVKALSGGERNRLLLARLFTRPANVLVLDEPTNDLDLETLELLEAELVEFPGTVLLVSHDRVFLDNVVTSTIAFEGGGRVGEYVGGYDDWLRQRSAPGTPAGAAPARTPPAPAAKGPKGAEAPKKLSFKERRELDGLPAAIEALEAERRRLHADAAAPDFYQAGADRIKATMARLEAIDGELTAAYARWSALEERAG